MSATATIQDVLDERAPVEAQARLWDLIRATARARLNPGGSIPIFAPRNEGGLDWLLLTKRPERWEIIPEDVRPLVWLGTSISDQETADRWVPRLLGATGFAKKFLSAEPLVGPINLHQSIEDWRGSVERGERNLIDWVIVGGESGAKPRACDVAWIRSIVEQCRAAGVACFVKQLGGYVEGLPVNLPGPRHPIDALVKWRTVLRDKKGGDPSEWPADLRVRQFPVSEVSHGK